MLLLVMLLIVPSQVPETLPEVVLEKMHAPPKPDVPIVDVHDLPAADGFVFAFPTR
jgi:NAD(P)H dehydrogenase (quinone)